MRYLFLIFLFITSFGFSQTKKSIKGVGQKSDIALSNSDNNVIKVYQGDGIKVYNMLDEKERQALFKYLNALPEMSQDFKQILGKEDLILEILRKIDEKANDGGILNCDKLKEEIENYVNENKKLRLENEKLRKETTNLDFVKVLDEAYIKLEAYDNKGYQEVFEKFKKSKKKKIEDDNKEVAKAAYLQAENNYFNITVLKTEFKVL